MPWSLRLDCRQEASIRSASFPSYGTAELISLVDRAKLLSAQRRRVCVPARLSFDETPSRREQKQRAGREREDCYSRAELVSIRDGLAAARSAVALVREGATPSADDLVAAEDAIRHAMEFLADILENKELPFDPSVVTKMARP